jgi:hypothetical protein
VQRVVKDRRQARAGACRRRDRHRLRKILACSGLDGATTIRKIFLETELQKAVSCVQLQPVRTWFTTSCSADSVSRIVGQALRAHMVGGVKWRCGVHRHGGNGRR